MNEVHMTEYLRAANLAEALAMPAKPAVIAALDNAYREELRRMQEAEFEGKLVLIQFVDEFFACRQQKIPKSVAFVAQTMFLNYTEQDVRAMAVLGLKKYQKYTQYFRYTGRMNMTDELNWNRKQGCNYELIRKDELPCNDELPRNVELPHFVSTREELIHSSGEFFLKCMLAHC